MLAGAWLAQGVRRAALDTGERDLRAFPATPALEDLYVSLVFAAAPKPEAPERLERALALHPASAVLKRALGKSLFDLSPDDDRAGRLLDEAVTAAPGDAEGDFYYGMWLCTATDGHSASGAKPARSAHLALPVEAQSGPSVGTPPTQVQTRRTSISNFTSSATSTSVAASSVAASSETRMFTL
jgi:hypothetical protein